MLAHGCENGYFLFSQMPAKKKQNDKPLTGKALVKEVNRRIRVARSYWDAHNNLSLIHI